MRAASRKDLVAKAAALAPQIRAVRDELESGRQLPAVLAQALDEAGLMQLYLPASMGGPEVDPISSYHVIEEISKVDGSVGWCTFLSSVGCYFSGWLKTGVGRELYGNNPHVRVAASFRNLGAAHPVDGGYMVTGRWNYASGIDHANWLAVNCQVVDENGPRLTPDGDSEDRMFMVPAEHAAIDDTWRPMGMLGTGSKDFAVEEIFVPVERSWGLWDPAQESSPLYDPRLLLTMTWTLVVANALGMARGAMEALVELANQSGSTRSSTLLRDRVPIQNTVGKAEAIINASRTYVLDSVGTVVDVVTEGKKDPGPEIAQARLAITHGMWEAVKAVDMLFHAAGTNAIHQKFPMERFFRDIHVCVQHGAGLLSNFDFGGQALMGLKPDDHGW
jgi:alkylation response protein AidB-like acyl-CoA dehydrogenase